MIDPNNLRRIVLSLIYNKQSGHWGGSSSLAEFIAFLYNEFDPLGKDTIILSKGHAVPILYAVLHEKGILNDKDLSTFREINSKLQGHPVHALIPELKATTGSLGQGLSIAIGHALAKKLKNEDGLVFCILGDGEMQEGQIYEALMFASKHNLDNLVAVLDSNGAQNDGLVENIMPLHNLQQIIQGFGWRWGSLDGHNYELLQKCKLFFEYTGQPKFLNLQTIKGKGVSFMESPEWHSKAPTREEYHLALLELETPMEQFNKLTGVVL